MALVKDLGISQFKVTLLDTNPVVWRRIHVPQGWTLARFHRVLQVVMGWENCHSYMFHIGSRKYGPPDAEEDGGPKLVEARRTRLFSAVSGVGSAFRYVYDFGDNWQHDVLLEAILLSAPGVTYPRCTAGDRCCPPEDVGGIGGYRDYLEAIADPNHEQHEEMMAWRGPFGPADFSIDKVNKELGRQFRPRRKPTTD